MEHESCMRKQEQVCALFATCGKPEDTYEKIIQLGKENPALDPAYKTPENLVHGCQSQMYLRAFLEKGKVIFQGESDALISSGLAALLILVYSGESPETILKCSPDYLKTLGIEASLSPNRSSGLYSIHLRMKQDALKFYMEEQRNKPTSSL